MDKYTLHERQKLPFKDKVMMTYQRINEWCDHWEDNVYLSFSGGKDSSVLRHLIAEAVGEGTVPSVFCDTGLEYPEVRKFATERADVVLKPTKTFKEVIEQYGYPFPSKEQSRYVHDIRHSTEKMRNMRLNGNKDGRYKLSKKWYPLIDAPFEVNNYCCDVMKKQPFKRFEKETGRKPIIATMAVESWLRLNRYCANGGCNAFNLKRPNRQPMAFWTEQDVYRYIVEYGVEIPSVYGDIVQNAKGEFETTGVHRTGCVFCMFGVDQEKEPNRFQQLEQTHPKLHRYCIEQLNLKQVLDYCDIPYTNSKEVK